MWILPLAWATKADLHLNDNGRGKIFDTVVLWDIDHPEGKSVASH